MSTEAQCKICHKPIYIEIGAPWQHEDIRIDVHHKAEPEMEEVTHPSQTRNFMSTDQATALGYQIAYISAMEIGLTKNGKGVRTWWANQFENQYPNLRHALIQEAIAINEGNNEQIERNSNPDASSARTEQLRTEIRNIIDRYGEESNLTMCEVLGVLELVKAEKIDQLRRMNEH